MANNVDDSHTKHMYYEQKRQTYNQTREMYDEYAASELVQLLLTVGKSAPAPMEHSALNQVNVTVVPRTKYYEDLLSGGLCTLIHEKKVEESRTLLPKIVGEPPVDEGKDFKAMISYLSKENRDHVEG